MRFGMRSVLGLFAAVLWHGASCAAETIESTRFVSLRSSEVNMRVGPGTEYPIEWIYVRQNLPVEVISEFGIWRRIRDMEGTEGWIHQSMASKNRTVFVMNEDVHMRRSDSTSSKAIALLKLGVIAQLKKCRQNWCEVKANQVKGWIEAKHLWGLNDKERQHYTP
jgi:SH3-like domain-containing protein